MIRRNVFTSVGFVLVLWTIVIGAVYAQELHQQQLPKSSTPSNALAATTAVSSTFSYQGVLQENGQPVTGDREMVFRLYANETCLEQVGTPLTYTVPVSAGLFSVDLAVNQKDFNGAARWLAVEVGGIAIGCQAIQAVPYALGLRPGAVISGALSEDTTVTVVNTDTNGSAVRGFSGTGGEEDIHPGGAYYYAAGEFVGTNGVIGAASADKTDGYGVAGLAQGIYGRGVYGAATSDTGMNYGVYGESSSWGGYGIYGRSTAITGTNSGVYGTSYSEEGHGIYGRAAAITGTNSGVYGRSNSPYGTGGYFTNYADNSAADLIVGGDGGGDDGRIATDPRYTGSDLHLQSNDEVSVYLDQDDNENASFSVYNGTETTIFSVDEDGNTSQPRTGDGLAKASAMVYCSNSSASVSRYFNNISSSGVSVIDGASAGNCTVDFNFQVSDRFWSATAAWSAARGVACRANSTYNDRLDCFRFKEDGAGQNGPIMLVIY